MKLSGKDLEHILPHRGRNLLIDTFERPDDSAASGISTLTLTANDPAGRDIFLRKSSSDREYALIEYSIVEHFALNGICLISGELSPGDISFFSAISKFTTEGVASAGSKLTGHVERKRDKGQFRRFKVSAEENGRQFASGEIMSFTLPAGSGLPKREETRKYEPVSVRQHIAADDGRFSWKRAEMKFIDECVSFDRESAVATFAYSYPSEHPLVAGHFPGNPVMMGITQWMAVGDAAWWMATELVGRDAPRGDSIVATGEIVRENGASVCEVKGLKLRKGSTGIPELAATRRVAFRDIVRPGETVFVRCRLG